MVTLKAPGWITNSLAVAVFLLFGFSPAIAAHSQASRRVLPANLSWVQVAGSAYGVAAAPDGTLWALSLLPMSQPDKHILHLVGNTWLPEPGYADHISMGPDGAPYVVSSRGGVYSYRGNHWTPINNSKMPASTAAVAADEGIYFLSKQNAASATSSVWRKTWLGRTSQLSGSGVQIAASFDTATYDVPGVGAVAPYGYFLLQTSGAVTYYNQEGTQAVQFPVTASAIAPVLGGFYALKFPQTAVGSGVYYYDYASGTTTAEPGTFRSLAAFAGSTSVPRLVSIDAQNRIWSAAINLPVSAVEITEYPIPGPQRNSSAFGITPGPDGAMWFAETGTNPNAIGRISSQGSISEYGLPSGNLEGGIVMGSDAALWFSCAQTIGRLTTSGVFTFFSFPGMEIAAPSDIVEGSDGAMWFTQRGIPPSIGRITTAGAISEYVYGFGTPLDGSGELGGIAPGSDGALWFSIANSEFVPDEIGRLSTSGVTTYYRLPLIYGQSPWPTSITAGADGALWFIELTGSPSSVGRITTSGLVKSYNLPNSPHPASISSGPDGALWFTTGDRSIGRITTTGVTAYYPIPTELSGDSIAPGADGAIYFTETLANKIGRITLGQDLSNSK